MKTLDSIDDLIRHHPFLEGLSAEHYSLLRSCATLKEFQPQQQIFREGLKADEFYLILKGEVALQTFVPAFGSITIQKLEPGEPLGWSWLIPPHEWQFTAVATEPTEVVAFNAAVLRDKAEADPEFRMQMLPRITKTLFQRLQAMRLHLIDFYSVRP